MKLVLCVFKIPHFEKLTKGNFLGFSKKILFIFYKTTSIQSCPVPEDPFTK